MLNTTVRINEDAETAGSHSVEWYTRYRRRSGPYQSVGCVVGPRGPRTIDSYHLNASDLPSVYVYVTELPERDGCIYRTTATTGRLVI
jgi:hypothetical protein